MEHHITVLKKEATLGLHIQPGATIVDATIGSLGHTREILSRIGTEGTFVGIDADPKAIEAAKSLESKGVAMHLTVGNFRDIDAHLVKFGITKVDGILADLGWRTEQFNDEGKGFSFNANEPLVMTYGDPASYPFSATDIVNSWKEEDIRNVLKAYGEERFASRIAKAIIEERATHKIETAAELGELVTCSVPAFYRRGKTHPATKTFQALRIAVNDELDALRTFIEKAIPLLDAKGRLAIITFHSLEDRIVKHTFRTLKENGEGIVVTKKPIRPTEEEINANPRARSAKLRIFEKRDKE